MLRYNLLTFLVFASFLSVAQRGITYPSTYSQVGLMSANPDQEYTTSRVPLVLDTSSNSLYVWQGDSTWLDLPTAVGDIGVKRYSVQSGSTTLFVNSNKEGVTVSEDANTGEVTVSVPVNCELYKITLSISNNTLDSGNDLYIVFDYDGVRNYNTSISTLNTPVATIGNASITPSRASPLFLASDGGANIDYGVSDFAGGDGSDLEISFKDLLLSSEMIINLHF